MKTILKSLLFSLSLGVFTSMVSFAEAKPVGRPANIAAYKAGVYTTVSGQLSIALNKEIGGAVDIRLKNAGGTVLYSQHLGKNESQYRTRLNMNELPDGTYQVEISNGVETTTHTITIATQQPSTPSRVIALN